MKTCIRFLVFFLAASVFADIPTSRDPKFTSSLNPQFTSSINPEFTSSINPKFTSSLNPANRRNRPLQLAG